MKGVVTINGSGNFKDCKLNDLKLRGSQFDLTDTLVRGNIHVKAAGFLRGVIEKREKVYRGLDTKEDRDDKIHNKICTDTDEKSYQ